MFWPHNSNKICTIVRYTCWSRARCVKGRDEKRSKAKTRQNGRQRREHAKRERKHEQCQPNARASAARSAI